MLNIADELRAARSQLAEIIQVTQPVVKCRVCGMARQIEQRSG